jgi:type I restriction enzyme R subunit
MLHGVAERFQTAREIFSKNGSGKSTPSFRGTSPTPSGQNQIHLAPTRSTRPVRYSIPTSTTATSAKHSKGDEFQILLVANKFQTGFDQPLLCGMYVDRRLAGIQAVQTLSRLNRAYPGKNTTYVLDFVNSSEEILKAFKSYYETAELEGVTDPNLIFDLKAKLDASGYYDEYEVDRVVAVEMNPKSKQGDLIAALEPVEDRLLRQFKQTRDSLKIATANNDGKAAEDANAQMNALTLFKTDIGAYQRMYSFLSQIFDYGNTAVEKRFIFYRRLSPLLEFGREREGIDLSKVMLTHHSLKDQGKRALPLGHGEAPKLPPISDAGSGSVQEKEKARLAEIIAKVNDLFVGDLTDDDQLIYVNNVIKGKLLECQELVVQASNNTKAQFANSPTLSTELMNAVMDALAAHTTMSKQALDSEKVREGLKDVLLGPAQLYEALREKGANEQRR